VKEYKLLYEALHQHRDLIWMQATIMEAELLHGASSRCPSQIHIDSTLPRRIHIAVHNNGMDMIDSLPDPEDATVEDMMDLFVHVITGALVHWEDLPVGEFTASEIARDGLARNPVLKN